MLICVRGLEATNEYGLHRRHAVNIDPLSMGAVFPRSEATMSEPHIKVLSKTEIVDGIKWRKLPAAVETDHRGWHWVPESKVVWIEEEADDE